MNNKMRATIASLALLIVLSVINYSIFDKQRLITQGQSILLQLAPVEPRSLMQGDYMALNYVVGQKIYADLPKVTDSKQWRRDVDAKEGYVVVQLDNNNVASYLRVDDKSALNAGELKLFYRVRGNRVKFASNAFFFEEGQANIYESAKFGEFKVAPDGELLLVALRDADYQVLGQ